MPWAKDPTTCAREFRHVKLQALRGPADPLLDPGPWTLDLEAWTLGLSATCLGLGLELGKGLGGLRLGRMSYVL